MRAHANKRNFLWRATCWVVSFTLAFTLFGTPAYAAEAADGGVEAAPITETVSETPAQTQEISAATDKALSSSSGIIEESAAASEEPDVATTEEADETAPEAPETDPEVSEDPDPITTDPIETEEPAQALSYSIVASSEYDYDTNTITYTVSVANTSETEDVELALDGYATVDATGAFYVLGLPATVQLPAGEAIIYTCPVVLDQQPTADAPVAIDCQVQAQNTTTWDPVVTDELHDSLTIRKHSTLMK